MVLSSNQNNNMKNVHVLSTEKLIKSAGDLVRDKYGSIHIFTKNDSKEYGKTTTKLNIYITSDEETKYGDWCYAILSKQTFQNINPNLKSEDKKKIILTTDDQLIKDGVQAIDYEFLQWFVKNPSCEQVEVKIEYKDGYGNWSVYDKEFWYKHGNKPKFGTRFKIIIPKEEPKQETVEEVAEKSTQLWFNNNDFTKELFIAGAKWQAERMYSKEEVIAIVEKSRETGLTAEYLLLTDQFKKK